MAVYAPGPTSTQNNLTGVQTSFTVANTGTAADAYTLSCSSAGNVTCMAVSPSYVSLSTGEYGYVVVTVTYSTGTVGSGSLTLTANGTVSGSGSMSVSIIANPAPTVSLA